MLAFSRGFESGVFASFDGKKRCAVVYCKCIGNGRGTFFAPLPSKRQSLSNPVRTEVLSMKKKLLIAVLAFALLTGCAPQNKPASSSEGSASSQIAPAPDMTTVTLAIPDDNAEYLKDETAQIPKQDDMIAALVTALTQRGALPEGTEVLATTIDETKPPVLAVDLNAAFGDAVSHTGTAGETMMLGSLINTLWNYYQPSSITLTVEDAPIETGHNIYDAPFEAPFLFD